MDQKIKSLDVKIDRASGELVPIGRDLIGTVNVELEARLGKTTMTVQEMLSLKNGSVVRLEEGLADHAELYLKNALIARGEIVAVGDHYGLRITDVASDA